MRLRSLTHLLSVVQSIVQPTRITILGSSSLLAISPDLGESGQPLELSYDADLLVSPLDSEQAAILVESLGQESLFSKRHGYYADILRPGITETLPGGWEGRLRTVPGCEMAFALHPYDLAIVKLVLGRGKDLELLRKLLSSGLLEPASLRNHYQQVALSEHDERIAGFRLQELLQTSG
jgi:hypothetical protein